MLAGHPRLPPRFVVRPQVAPVPVLLIEALEPAFLVQLDLFLRCVPATLQTDPGRETRRETRPVIPLLLY